MGRRYIYSVYKQNTKIKKEYRDELTRGRRTGEDKRVVLSIKHPKLISNSEAFYFIMESISPDGD